MYAKVSHDAKNIFDKKVSSTVIMEERQRNHAPLRHIWRVPVPHGHLMGENSVHLPALSGQVRVHIALQGDVGVSVS